MQRVLSIPVGMFLLAATMLMPGHLAPRASAAVPQLATATKAGWWIKIRTDRTEAASIDFQIGTEREARESWCTWRSSDATEFDVPDKYLQVARIYVSATANPQGKKGWFCLMYKDHGVKHYDFDNRQEEDRSQTDSDGDCN
jgi:hypothetical protein